MSSNHPSLRLDLKDLKDFKDLKVRSEGGKNNPMSDFFEKVYEVVRLIPAGRVTSYGAIAAYLGSGGSSRRIADIVSAAVSRL